MIGAVLVAGFSLVDLAVLIVVMAAIIALVYVALRAFGVAPPPWVVHCFWIVVVTFVVILCIKLVAGMF